MNKNDKSCLQACAAAMLLAGSSAAGAGVNLKLESDVGYDSNVFNLSDGVGVRGGAFVRLDFNAGAALPTMGRWVTELDAGATTLKYGTSVEDGNETQVFARVGGDSGGKRGDHRFTWAMRYRDRDSTYVSHFTGDVATYGGTSIGDRYDSGILDATAEWRLPDTSFGRFSLSGGAVSKNYKEDYDGLLNSSLVPTDRLDYGEFELRPALELGDKVNTFRVRVPVALRKYRDRRISDVNGAAIAGTDLEYRYVGLDLRFQRDLTHTSRLAFSGDVERRMDNGGGYGDLQRWSVGSDWSWHPAADQRLSAGLKWSSRVLNNTNASDPAVVDESPDKKGYSISVNGQTPFPGVSITGLSLVAELNWESFRNSNDDRYTYDRWETFLGVRKEF